MNQEKILGIVRHVLTFGGGFLVAKGWVNAEQLAEIIGIVSAAWGVIWSIRNKNNTIKIPQ